MRRILGGIAVCVGPTRSEALFAMGFVAALGQRGRLDAVEGGPT